MKGIRLLFAGCLALLVFQAAIADDAGDAARAATRRSSATTVVSSRQKSDTTTKTTPSASVSRSTNLSTKSNSGATVRERTAGPRSGTVVQISDTTRTGDTASATVSARATSKVQSRATTQSGTVISSPARTATRSASTPTRTAARTAAIPASATRNGTTISRAGVTASRAASSKTAARSATRAGANRISRAAAEGASEISVSDILNRDYSTCREVYYSCMDEFCANKDSQLKRCACSSRVNEFDDVKKQLSQVEDKLLDFNQRLLTVNMDKEDAAALNQATEGELAFQQEDTSESKKILDEIAKKLNTSFDDSNFDQSLNAISLSLNVDSAFDSVDSLQGASTTTKTGTALYNAALPVCREMALEVCTQDELDIAESGYQMTIEQDCNTVAKAYETQQDQAREKIREGSALLDMSRLDIYQKRNSDDILTCKKKMLAMLTDSTVCGEDLGKCLDTTGRYIDPSTGEAFLTVDLANLGNLITRPDANQTWTNAPGNDRFVSFLNSKKKFLEPAMENCQDIADYVWDAFIEDALAQIKLAQESKLEDMRQSCTTLTTQCLDDAADSLEDFDARALSTFGVAADKTVNEMCSEVRLACTALLDSTGAGEIWDEGMTEIAADKTYDTIIKTCREVGRACIIQSCKSISGNFGLCESLSTSVNRKSIINRTACWDEVVNCVATATSDSISTITSQLSKAGLIGSDGSFYKHLYGAPYDITNDENPPQCILDPLTDQDGNKKEEKDVKNCIYDICTEECENNQESHECRVCRLAEKIWGNCEAAPTTDLRQTDSHNRIKKPQDTTEETLMYWFAKNTGTEDMKDNCRDTTCGAGYKVEVGDDGSYVCVPSEYYTNDGEYCPTPNNIFTITNGITNCCKANASNVSCLYNNNCCKTGTGIWKKLPTGVTGLSSQVCMPADGNYTADEPIAPPVVSIDMGNTKSGVFQLGENILFCIPKTGATAKTSGKSPDGQFPGGYDKTCDGYFIVISKDKYISPGDPAFAKMQYVNKDQATCTWDPKTGKWKDGDNECVSAEHWSITYGQ